jgi:hypothetical protein
LTGNLPVGGDSRPERKRGGVVMAVRRGEVYESPVTGERLVIRCGTAESGGELLTWDLYLQAGGAVVGEHVHPSVDERFTLVRGRLGFRGRSRWCQR